MGVARSGTPVLGAGVQQLLGHPGVGSVLSSDEGLARGRVQSLGVLVGADGRLLLMKMKMKMMTAALLGGGVGALGGGAWQQVVGVRPTLSADVDQRPGLRGPPIRV